MTVYKITLRNHWDYLSIQLFILLAVIAMLGFKRFYEHASYEDFRSLLTFLSVVFLVQLTMHLALHINYYQVNKKDELSYDKVGEVTTFIHNGSSIIYKNSDVDSITIYKTRAWGKRTPITEYQYCVIVLKNKTQITLTSLLTGGEFQLPYTTSKVKRETKFFRWVNGQSVEYL